MKYTILTAYDQMNQHRTIDFRAPVNAVSEAASHYDGMGWVVGKRTADRIAGFAHRLTVSTVYGPLQVFIIQEGPDEYRLILKP